MADLQAFYEKVVVYNIRSLSLCKNKVYQSVVKMVQLKYIQYQAHH